MITVEEAEKIILANAGDYGAEIVMFDEAAGRVLFENIKADRDFPPYNRVTMDGIAIRYEAIERGISTFTVRATQAAGDMPVNIEQPDECVEIMTGASLPITADTVIRYEDLIIKNGIATLQAVKVKYGQNVHLQGSDRKQGDILAVPGQMITPALVSLIASVGETEVRVKKVPRIAIVSTGDELVPVNAVPAPFQVRQSNSYTIQAILRQHGVTCGMLHLPDDPDKMKDKLQDALYHYDGIILSGGVSAGKFDYLPKVLEELQVEKLFHKVSQRPGKPFWFGRSEQGIPVFAFPGNPVAVFLCTHRYFLPWLRATLGMPGGEALYAVLDNDLTFNPALNYFLQVKLEVNTRAQLVAIPVAGNGSGDFANLADVNAFMELPADKNEFKKGEVYKIHLISPIYST
ncbi:molybdopterin molybdenumtransferase MoeA [Mucilaginibacter hurinus]|uniref:Molybdopterin molybdenumtransferase n=1 Tax=Mucilaginibacter hurinus TaxID=2201324 RepID=A0A367GSM4_9SPHI|nr:molybdopterin molybdotransferase MoeA [Mucilaginibacter hurinus]RCH56085.1 molybdopterin molybdenumtransferase MoeA [Mucilaginibacter hurinus]